ncbi:hypothetical protein JOB18_000170 [Solea senegalensis]|uniref:Uncharacterized protein n=1 Tax=Solea senegalensis TaxID=28829 RepID=A0AAV6SJA7_SOLSE|nr:hypothetical protein JOB18_000170 [Solea senegalensis]
MKRRIRDSREGGISAATPALRSQKLPLTAAQPQTINQVHNADLKSNNTCNPAARLSHLPLCAIWQECLLKFGCSSLMRWRSAMESMSMVTFTPVIFSVHLVHTPPLLLPPPPLRLATRQRRNCNVYETL